MFHYFYSTKILLFCAPKCLLKISLVILNNYSNSKYYNYFLRFYKLGLDLFPTTILNLDY